MNIHFPRMKPRPISSKDPSQLSGQTPRKLSVGSLLQRTIQISTAARVPLLTHLPEEKIASLSLSLMSTQDNQPLRNRNPQVITFDTRLHEYYCYLIFFLFISTTIICLLSALYLLLKLYYYRALIALPEDRH